MRRGVGTSRRAVAGRGAGLNRRVFCAATVVVALAAGSVPEGGVPAGDVPAAGAQETPGPAPARAAVRLSLDTVRVGEPFTLGVVVRPAPGAGGAVRLPPLVGVETEAWEQLDVARIEQGEDGEVRGYYRLVAWKAEPLELPALSVDLVGAAPGSGRSLRLELPAPVVRSVLPAGTEEPWLRGPRPPHGEAFPWMLALLLALLAAALAWWWWRRRRAGRAERAAVAPPPDPRELARRELADLRARVVAGEVVGAAAYDRLEDILRTYLASTHEWPPALPVRASPWTARGAMRELHRRAAVVRFAGVVAAEEPLLADLDASLAWLSKAAA